MRSTLIAFIIAAFFAVALAGKIAVEGNKVFVEGAEEYAKPEVHEEIISIPVKEGTARCPCTPEVCLNICWNAGYRPTFYFRCSSCNVCSCSYYPF